MMTAAPCFRPLCSAFHQSAVWIRVLATGIALAVPEPGHATGLLAGAIGRLGPTRHRRRDRSPSVARNFLATATATVAMAVPMTANAQQITNLDTGSIYTDLAAAVDGATAGDTFELAGTVTGGVFVDRNLTFVAAPGGATLQSAGDEILELASNAILIVDGIDLIGAPETRAINGVDGSNTVDVRNATIDARANVLNGENGGAVHLIDPREVTFSNVVFVGKEGQSRAAFGGALYVYSPVGGVPVTLTDVRFESIEASSSGGAVWAGGVALSCIRCVFDHTRGAFGGAIYSESGSLFVAQSSVCGSGGGLGGAIFSSSNTEIYGSVFQENGSNVHGGALYANGGFWTVENNHFVGNAGSSVFYAANLPLAIDVTNNLFLENPAQALDLDVNSQPTETYNWFHGNLGIANYPLDVTNIKDGGDPGLVSWTFDNDCSDDDLQPTPITSPLLDAGDPIIADVDGSRSDIGAYGGPWAVPEPGHAAGLLAGTIGLLGLTRHRRRDRTPVRTTMNRPGLPGGPRDRQFAPPFSPRTGRSRDRARPPFCIGPIARIDRS